MHFLSIQALRAVAALLVVFHHAQDDSAAAALQAGMPMERVYMLPWAAGVDLFFVISGFVMVYSAEKLFQQPAAGWRFITRRIARIVPLYWIATLLFGLFILRGAAVGKVASPSVAEFIASLTFIPWPRALDGAARPILSLGWTLEYEMFFYVIFALCVHFSLKKAVATIVLLLSAIVAFGALWQPQNIALAFWSDPIILEFALGMLIALAYRHGVRLQAIAITCLMGSAAVILSTDLMDLELEDMGAVTPNGFLRLFAWGIPMACVFASMVLGAGETNNAASATATNSASKAALQRLAALGDASYALYLFHPLALILLRKLWLGFELQTVLGFWPLLLLQTSAAIGLSLWIHRRIEIPLTRMAQNWLTHRPKAPNAISI